MSSGAAPVMAGGPAARPGLTALVDALPGATRKRLRDARGVIAALESTVAAMERREAELDGAIAEAEATTPGAGARALAGRRAELATGKRAVETSLPH